MKMQQGEYSLRLDDNRLALRQGIRDGVPIGLGYLAVAFSLGIAARSAGLSPWQGLLASLLNNASAGEYAGFTVIAAAGTYMEIAIITLVANARYLLMSCALSQRMKPGTKFIHRLVLGFDVTDELFGITIARPGYINPVYTYGAILVAAPCWAGGTALGVAAGAWMPVRLASALGVALYGMFLAVIVPPARKSKVVAGLIFLSFLLSGVASKLPPICYLSDGTRTIVLTVVLSAGAALFFPHEEDAEEVQP